MPEGERFDKNSQCVSMELGSGLDIFLNSEKFSSTATTCSRAAENFENINNVDLNSIICTGALQYSSMCQLKSKLGFI